MKPQIYKVGINWILWIPGEGLFCFSAWRSALSYVLGRKGRSVRTRVLSAAG